MARDKTTTLGPMAEVIRNSLSYLTDADLRAIGEYLKSLPPDSSLRTGRRQPDPTRVRGAQLYVDNCSGCHQVSGKGIPGVFPPLAGNGVVVAADPNNILKVVDRGIKAREGFIAMPAFATQLTDQQVGRHRELRAHELGQQGAAERDARHGGAHARAGGSCGATSRGRHEEARWRARQDSNL